MNFFTLVWGIYELEKNNANASVIHLTGILMSTPPQSKQANDKVYGYMLFCLFVLLFNITIF